MRMAMFRKGGPMAAKRFEVELPEEVVPWFGWQETEVPYKVREALVMELLRRHVISLYKFACRNFRETNDEIYAFGFSRGAFSIRVGSV